MLIFNILIYQVQDFIIILKYYKSCSICIGHERTVMHHPAIYIYLKM